MRPVKTTGKTLGKNVRTDQTTEKRLGKNVRPNKTTEKTLHDATCKNNENIIFSIWASKTETTTY